MPHKDPEKRKQYAREWAAKKRAEDPTYVENERIKAREYQRQRRKDDPEKVYLIKLKQTLAQYGLTHEEFVLLEYAQNGVCAICGKAEPVQKRLSVDHDHNRGKECVRGLLCTNCNNGLGRFRDDPEVLRRAVAYLEGYSLAQFRLERYQGDV